MNAVHLPTYLSINLSTYNEKFENTRMHKSSVIVRIKRNDNVVNFRVKIYFCVNLADFKLERIKNKVYLILYLFIVHILFTVREIM